MHFIHTLYVELNTKQEVYDNEMVNVHDILILETTENQVCGNKEKVLNWGLFDCDQEMNDILI